MKRLSKREFILLLLPISLLTIYFSLPYIVPQKRNLRHIRNHIVLIQPGWLKFKEQNPGCEGIQPFAYTGGDGLLGVGGRAASTNDLRKVAKFLESTQPPRPIVVFAKTSGLDLKNYQILTGKTNANSNELTE